MQHVNALQEEKTLCFDDDDDFYCDIEDFRYDAELLPLTEVMRKLREPGGCPGIANKRTAVFAVI